jgi:hypothetical protein
VCARDINRTETAEENIFTEDEQVTESGENCRTRNFIVSAVHKLLSLSKHHRGLYELGI